MLKSLLSLFIQSPCPLCQRQTKELVCIYCQKKLKSHQVKHYERRLPIPNSDPSNCLTNQEKESKGNLSVLAWGEYEGELKRAIAILKYHNQPQLGVLLGQWLGQNWLDSPPGKKNQKLTVVPIPLYQHKLKTRGFNQSAKIAQGFCQVTGYALKPQGLIRVRDTKAMFGLNPQQRQKNVKNAFVVNQNWQKTPPRSPILLLDDIYTTGSTIQEAKKILARHYIKAVGVAVVAIAQRKV